MERKRGETVGAINKWGAEDEESDETTKNVLKILKTKFMIK